MFWVRQFPPFFIRTLLSAPLVLYEYFTSFQHVCLRTHQLSLHNILLFSDCCKVNGAFCLPHLHAAEIERLWSLPVYDVFIWVYDVPYASPKPNSNYETCSDHKLLIYFLSFYLYLFHCTTSHLYFWFQSFSPSSSPLVFCGQLKSEIVLLQSFCAVTVSVSSSQSFTLENVIKRRGNFC